ncbi:MAG: hypothetical protein ACOYZ7_13275 [Chloroflexota bacterium]
MSKRSLFHLLAVMGLAAGLLLFTRLLAQANSRPPGAADELTQAHPGAQDAMVQASAAITLHLPLVFKGYPWISPFGFESNLLMSPGSTLLTRADELGAQWARLGSLRISWRELQPTEGGPLQWDEVAGFEEELRALRQAGLTPAVLVIDSPTWATVQEYGSDGERSYCAAVRADKFNAFASFLSQLVARYKTSEFNVHHWEIGNEPDVDPSLVPHNYWFGCWGDIGDPYYGGRHYGDMLKVVGPAIKAEDSNAQVWIGGLLLNRPDTTNPYQGKPELFLKGILEAGAAPYFDIVAYHSYPPYGNVKVDYDNGANGVWDSWGGGAVGKARYLRQTMSQYGVDKPLFLNETSLMCPDYYSWCNPPGNDFYQSQANHVVRTFVRGLGEDIMGFVWYTLNGPGWRYTGLLDDDDDPQPAYTAYQRLTTELHGTHFVEAVDYGAGIEAYAFRRSAGEYVHVVWAESDTLLTITLPQSSYIVARNRDGATITPTTSGSDYRLDVQFEPIYVWLNR